MNWWIEHFNQIIIHPSIAGLIGTVIYLLLLEKKPFRTYILSFIGGMACVFYGAPILAEKLQIFSTYGPTVYGFLCGLLGMDVIVKGREAFKQMEFKTLIRAFFSFSDWLKSLQEKDEK